MSPPKRSRLCRLGRPHPRRGRQRRQRALSRSRVPRRSQRPGKPRRRRSPTSIAARSGKIATGKVEVEARIDLHGLRQRDAHLRLRAFLIEAHARGHKTVLVITGKGGEEPADRYGELAGERQRGVLRRNVPQWLGEPELRAIVLSFTQAGVRHGGAGALYVQLRKSRTT